MNINRKDLAAGLIFIAFGAFYGLTALKSLPMGRPLNMGPGYFPIVLSCLLALIGAAVAIRAFIMSGETPFGIVPWRAVIMLSLATLVFAAGLTGLGMLPAIFITGLLACLASSQIKLTTALIVAASVAVFCTAVFTYGIRLPIPTLGTWFSL